MIKIQIQVMFTFNFESYKEIFLLLSSQLALRFLKNLPSFCSIVIYRVQDYSK